MTKCILTRESLYKLIWNTPRVKILKKYLISEHGFKKLCSECNIPIPKSGYWQKIQYGKPITIEKLPSNFEGESKIELSIREKGQTNIVQTPLGVLTNEIESDKNAPLTVPKRLINPETITLNTKEYYLFLKTSNRRSDFKKTTLPIRVEKENQNRALKLMDTLVKLLKYRGHSISKRNYETVVVIKGIKAPIYLREKTKRIPAKNDWSSGHYVPTGKFIIKLGRCFGEKEIGDNKIKLENRLAKIVAYLELYANQELKQKEENRLYQIKKKKEEEIKKEKETIITNEISKLNELISNSNHFEKAQRIRGYINAYERHYLASQNLDKRLEKYIKWARDKADWYDPIISKHDEILKDVEK